jgi:predicted PurR-regulated permease PerM
VSTIDNIVRPKIVGSRGNIHPVLVLLGIVGGLELFGILGMIIGPLILAILTVFLGLYADEREKR